MCFSGSFPAAYPRFRSVGLAAGLFRGGYEAQCLLKWLPCYRRRGAVPLVSLLRVQKLPACDERQIKWKGPGGAAGSAPRSEPEHPHLQLGFLLGSSGELCPAQRPALPIAAPRRIPSPLPPRLAARGSQLPSKC